MRSVGPLSLIVGIALLPMAVALQNPKPARAFEDLSPVAVEEIPAIPNDDAPPADDAAPRGPTRLLGGARDLTVPHRHPVDTRTYEALKGRAARDRAAPEGGLPAPLNRDLVPTVVTSFAGLDRPGAANNGLEFFPPDTIVAKSTTRVLEAANSALRLFATSGGVLQTRDLNAFFGVSFDNGFVFDPKVYFDRNASNRRFYVVALQSDFFNTSRILLAVSRGPDPANLNATNWCRYNIDGRRNVGGSNASFADYPGLGAGADALVISTNQFRFLDDLFTFAIVRAIRKIPLANNAATCPALQMFTFQATQTIDDDAAFTLQPAQHYTNPSSFMGTTNPAYLVSTRFGSSTTYRLWQLRNVGGSPPTLRFTNVSGPSYGIQPDAPQRGSDLLLATGDNRMTQAAGIGNAVSGVHGTVCQFGGGPNESCIRLVRFVAGQSAGGALMASLSSSTNLGGGSGVFYFWPGVAVNGDQQTAVVFQRSSATTFLSARWALKDLAAANFATTGTLTGGTCAQEISDRTGDYTGAQTDPSDFTSFWLAGERATNIAGDCQWQTRIIKVAP